MTFEEILQEHKVPYQTEGRYCRTGWVQFQCPWCRGGTDANKPYMGYHKQFKFVNCWRCGRHKLGETLAALIGQPLSICIKLAGELPGQRYEPQLHTGKLIIPYGVGPLQQSHRRYLIRRGFDPHHIAKTWGVQGIGLAPRLQWRLWIPIHQNGNVVSWTTQACNNKLDGRYISASITEESVPHRSLLYGADYARHAVVVVEGPMDAWRVGPGAVATLGTSYTVAQVAAIAAYPKRSICFDSEPAAQQRAKTLADSLSVFDGETINIQLDAKDPDSAKPRELHRLRRVALHI